MFLLRAARRATRRVSEVAAFAIIAFGRSETFKDYYT
jgi:hypothetical protein